MDSKTRREIIIWLKSLAIWLKWTARGLLTALIKGEDAETWLNGWHRMGATSVLLGTQVCCVGCGKDNGTTCVAISADWVPPQTEPDWPFSEDDCPVCELKRLLAESHAEQDELERYRKDPRRLP